MEELEQKEKRQVPSIFKTAKKIFPNWISELSFWILCVCVIMLSFTLNKTAPLSLELSLVNSGVVLDENGKEVLKNQHSQFSINNPEQDNPIVTSKENVINTSKVCFIGDAMFSSMKSVLLTDASFSADENANLEWFNTTGKASIESCSKSIDTFVVSIGMNDIDNKDKYIEALNAFANENEDKNFIFVNIAPIDESKNTSITNKQIEIFNKEIQKELNQKWRVIDLHKYVVENDFNIVDGTRYSIGDLANIFSWIVNSISKEMNV